MVMPRINSAVPDPPTSGGDFSTPSAHMSFVWADRRVESDPIQIVSPLIYQAALVNFGKSHRNFLVYAVL